MKINVPTIDNLMWCALTLWQECNGESYLGKLAVANVIFRRAGNNSVSDTVFAPYQFSAWNTDSPTRKSLDEITPDNPVWIECYKAACSAFFKLEADPSNGATSYLNPELTKKIRGGTLPKWAADPTDPTKINVALVTATINNHVFIK